MKHFLDFNKYSLIEEVFKNKNVYNYDDLAKTSVLRKMSYKVEKFINKSSSKKISNIILEDISFFKKLTLIFVGYYRDSTKVMEEIEVRFNRSFEFEELNRMIFKNQIHFKTETIKR